MITACLWIAAACVPQLASSGPQEGTVPGAVDAASAQAVEPGLVQHAEPRPLAKGAVTSDWPSFLGAARDAHSNESPLDSRFGPEGPRLIWSVERGDSFASPVVADGRLIYMHRVGGEVHVDCRVAESGKRLWRHSFPCDYEGRYFDSVGPRATPTIVGDRVVVHGVGGEFMALSLEDGEPIWTQNTTDAFNVGDDFFGVVSSPLVVGDQIIQNVGAPGGPSVASFDLGTGKLRWGAGKEWGPSCASPVLARIAGEDRILVIAGGESRPPTGGLMVMTPTGELSYEYAFRSRTTLSVNGPSPVPIPGGVYLTAAYNVGSAVVDIDGSGKGAERWRDRRGLALEFPTPVFEGGEVLAVNGVSGRAGALVAIDPKTGKERARRPLQFEQTIGEGESKRVIPASVGKGSLLVADGVLWVLGDTGQLVTAKRTEEGFEVLSQAPLFLAQETWTPLVLSRGLLYVCQNNRAYGGGARARLLCYDVRGAAK